MPSKSRKWTLATVERTRASVAAILAGKAAAQPRMEVLRFAAAQVLLLENDRSELAQLLRLTYALAALDLNQNGGGLAARHVEELAGHARAILAKQGIAASGSKLGHLHADLETMVGNLDARAGRVWQAARRQSSAQSTARRSEAEAPGRFALAMGLRQLRFGAAAPALASFRLARTAGLADDDLARVALAELRTTRLAGELETARRLFEAPPAAKIDPDAWRWEGLLITAQGVDGPKPLALATRKGEADYLPERLATAVVYQLAAEPLVDRRSVPRLETIVRRRDLSWPLADPWLRAARAFDAAEVARSAGEALPLAAMDEVLDAAAVLPDVEQELLAWAAASRLFLRTQDYRLASLALRRYRALSWSLSDAANADVLGLVGSLMHRSWFTLK